MALALKSRTFSHSLKSRYFTSHTFDSGELTFDGGDYMVLPQVTSIFWVSLSWYKTTNQTNACIMIFQNSGLTKAMGLYANADGTVTIEATNGFGNTSTDTSASLPNDIYHDIILTFDGTTLLGIVGGETISVNTNIPIIGELDEAYMGKLGATYLPNGTKIKNVLGTYRFGTIYEDTDDEAEVNDTVKSITNKGFAGGTLTQTTAGARPTYSAATTITYSNPTFNLPTRSGPGAYTPAVAGDGAVFDSDVFDGSIFG